MIIYSFEKDNKEIVFDYEDNNISMYDLFERSMYEYLPIKDGVYKVDIDLSCRIDYICYDIYETDYYTEELMVMNNILNPFSVEKDLTLFYTFDTTNFKKMYLDEPKINTTNKYRILNINKNKTGSNVDLPPSVNPGLNQIEVDYDKKRITVINKFK